MDKKSINQNESIQGGLEKFLEDQMLEYEISQKEEMPAYRAEKKLRTEFASDINESPIQKKAEAQNDPGKRYAQKLSEIEYEEDEEDGYKDSYEDELEEDYDGGEDYDEEDYDEEDYDEEENDADEEYEAVKRNRKKRRSVASHSHSSGHKGKRPSSSDKKKAAKKKAADKKKKGKKGKEKKKASKLKKVLIILLITLLALGIWWFFMVGSAYRKMTHDKTGGIAAGPMKEEGVINVLLIGNDSRENGDDGRSDAMILVSISNKTKTIHMTSLLRDMYVEIPGHDPNRLNAAYSYGGPTLLCETIEKNLGITVNRYAIVNFQAFAGLVDSVGGVDLEVTNEEVQWINAYLNEYNLLEGRELTTDYLDTSLSGLVHLNGPQALAYSRNRYIGTDFGRTERQRKVLNAVVKKIPVAMATNSDELIEGLFTNLTTNLSQFECYQLSLDASKLLSYDVIQSVVPAEGTYKNATIRKMAVLEVDYEANKRILRRDIYGEE